MLAELEEVIEYKLVPERRPVIKEMWWHRLKGIFSDKIKKKIMNDFINILFQSLLQCGDRDLKVLLDQQINIESLKKYLS
jgi:hypothetical protein